MIIVKVEKNSEYCSSDKRESPLINKKAEARWDIWTGKEWNKYILEKGFSITQPVINEVAIKGRPNAIV